MSELVVICGSRGWLDGGAIRQRVAELPEDSIVIHGGAVGADQMAGTAATYRDLHVAVMKPLWHRYGRAAGQKRNAAMLRLRPDRVIAFTLGTSGTQGTIDQARELGIPVEVIGTEAQ
jgi:hypothetical protein